jgi:glucose-6-phosphate dehydrogenase assembly protein OpcA
MALDINGSQSIPIAKIESSLKQLWDGHGTENRMQACLFNLVVYAETPLRIARMRQVVQDALRYFPCRVLFIEVDKEKEVAEITARVSIESIGEAAPGIACDQIVLTVPSQLVQRVPFILFPLLIPDLPIYLLWGKDPTEELVVLPQLIRNAHRLLFEAGIPKSLTIFSATLLSFLKEYPGVEYVDLYWLAISGWRAIFYQVFDSPPHLLQLEKTRRIELYYNEDHTIESQENEKQTLYFTAWLASRMGWKPLSNEEGEKAFEWKFAHSEGEVTVSWIPQRIPMYNPGTLFKMEIESYEGWHYAFVPQQENSKIVAYISSRETCDLPFTLSLSSLKFGVPYIRDLFYAPVSSAYPKTLQMLEMIAAKRSL